MFIHYFSLLLGFFLILFAIRALKNLYRNNKQWQNIKNKSHLFDINLFMEFETVKKNIVKHLNKYVTTISILSIVNAVLIITIVLLYFAKIKLEINLDLSMIGNIGLVIVSIFSLIMVNSWVKIFDDENNITSANYLYKIYIDYFLREYQQKNDLIKGIVKEYDYKNDLNYKKFVETKNNKMKVYPTILFLSFSMGLFLLLLALLLDSHFLR